MKERIKVERISLDEFRMYGVQAEKSPYFLPIFRKMHWRRLDLALNLMLENLDLSSKKCVIGDFGCGLGIFTRSIGKLFSHSKIIGLDYTKSLIHTQKLCPSDNTMFSMGDVQNLPFKPDSFDFIVSLDVLEHVDDPITALQEINRVLKDDGVFLVSVPLEMILLRIIREILIKLKISRRMPTHYSHYHGTIKSCKEFYKVLEGIFSIQKKIYTPLNLLGALNYGCVFVCKKRGRNL